MIITIKKPFNEIETNLKPYARVFVVGCAACATKCQTGSEEAVKDMITRLEKAGKEITGFKILDTPCDIRIAKKDLSKSREVDNADCLLLMSCGAGFQSVGSVIDKDLVPALNPVFTGVTERIGFYKEFCGVCGECMIDRTEGLCPITRCAKGLVNGPCGGTINGKCEVDLESDCVWALIFEKLNKKGKTKDFVDSFMPPRKTLKPKKIVNKK